MKALALSLFILSSCATISPVEKEQLAQRTTRCEQFKTDPRNNEQLVWSRPYYVCMQGVLPEDVDSVAARKIGGYTAIKGIKWESAKAIMGYPDSEIDLGNGDYRYSWIGPNPDRTATVEIIADVSNNVVTRVSRVTRTQ